MKIMKLFFLLLPFAALFCCKSTADKVDVNIKNDPRNIAITEADKNTDKLKIHMKNLFTLIEDMIARGDYDGWYNSISLKYKYYLNNSTNLKKIADESDFLFNRKINLRTPKDYFLFVVIPSREGKTLSFIDYEYIDNNHVKVVCLFDKKEKLIYDFIFEDNVWKIDR